MVRYEGGRGQKNLMSLIEMMILFQKKFYMKFFSKNVGEGDKMENNDISFNRKVNIGRCEGEGV